MIDNIASDAQRAIRTQIDVGDPSIRHRQERRLRIPRSIMQELGELGRNWRFLFPSRHFGFYGADELARHLAKFRDKVSRRRERAEDHLRSKQALDEDIHFVIALIKDVDNLPRFPQTNRQRGGASQETERLRRTVRRVTLPPLPKIPAQSDEISP